MPYDYEKFHKLFPVDIHDQTTRHMKIASLCRGKVLDIGCGTGTLSDYFLGEYVGFDISREAVKKAKEIRRKDAQFLNFNCAIPTDLTFGGYDTIVMSEFLEHIDDDSLLFEKIRATAQPGTRLVISVPNGGAIQCDEHVRTFTIPQLRAKFRPFGDVLFYNWTHEKQQIICTVDFQMPSADELSLVMIVKNEAKGLENCLLSAIEHVDFIKILVDDKTTDQTHKIAKLYADKVEMFTFRDDFAAARNLAASGVLTPWQMFLDGHEYIDKFEGVRDLLGSEHDGLMCAIQMDDGMMFNNPRIYRTGVIFDGAVHERQLCKNVGNASGVLIKHDRLGKQSVEAAAERERQRDDMVPRIMGEQVAQNPKNTRALFHLALWAWSKKKFRLSLKWAKKYLKYGRVPGERWFVFFNMSLCHLALGHVRRAFWYASRAEDETPRRWEIEKLKGIIFLAGCKPFQAVECFIASFNQNEGAVFYKPWVRDDAGTWNAIGECFVQLNLFDKASLAFAEAAKQCEDKKLKPFFLARAHLLGKIAVAQAAQQPPLTK